MFTLLFWIYDCVRHDLPRSFVCEIHGCQIVVASFKRMFICFPPVFKFNIFIFCLWGSLTGILRFLLLLRIHTQSNLFKLRFFVRSFGRTFDTSRLLSLGLISRLPQWFCWQIQLRFINTLIDQQQVFVRRILLLQEHFDIKWQVLPLELFASLTQLLDGRILP